MDATFFEFVKVCTTGPGYLRLNADALQCLYAAYTAHPALHCASCERVLLAYTTQGRFQNPRAYYVYLDNTDQSGNGARYVCHDCSIWSTTPRHVVGAPTQCLAQEE